MTTARERRSGRSPRRLYAVIKLCRKAPEPNGKSIFGAHPYNFGDGWLARVDVSQVDAKEASRLRKASKGFCGYEWMIDSILTRGMISTGD